MRHGFVLGCTFSVGTASAPGQQAGGAAVRGDPPGRAGSGAAGAQGRPIALPARFGPLPPAIAEHRLEFDVDRAGGCAEPHGALLC